MTCISAITHKQKVYMACDSGIGMDNDMSIMDGSKVCQKIITYRNKPEAMLIGTAGTARIGQLIAHQFEPPPRTTSNIMKYLTGEFTDAFRQVLEQSGAMGVYDNKENNSFYSVIGYKGKLYSWCVNYSVVECIEGFIVEGSGYKAHGVLYALKDSKMSPTDKLLKTQEYAAKYCSGVRPPFHVYST